MRTAALCFVPAVVFAVWVVAFIRTFRIDASDTEGEQ
jgi:hypothetical protein